MKGLKTLTNILHYNCAATPKLTMILNSSKRGHEESDINEPLLDLLSKHYRKFHLEQPIAEFRKVIVPAKRLRTLEDHLELLKSKREIPSVIAGREEFKDIDVVFDHYQITAMKRRVGSNVAPIYVRLPETGEDIRCILQKISKHATEDWIIKLYLNRYIVGRPNLLFLPIQLEHSFKNSYINRGAIMSTEILGVWVNCYNETYPAVLKLDVTNVTPSRPYKIGDLLNSMPQGITLHERYDKIIHRNILSIGKDQEFKFLQQVELQRSLSDEKSGAAVVQDELLLDEVYTGINKKVLTKELIAKQTVASKKKKEYSLKKKVLKVNQELKKEMDLVSKAEGKK